MIRAQLTIYNTTTRTNDLAFVEGDAKFITDLVDVNSVNPNVRQILLTFPSTADPRESQ